MEKKYIIVVVAVVVLWAAFMGFRHFNKQEESQAHREDTYRRMIEAAQKSPRSGLYEMAEAVRKYHADNNVYPPNLGILYPKYMPSKTFIEQIDWNYVPDVNNFYLSKATTYNNQTMVASIDSDMRPAVETSGVMVAAKRTAPRKAPEEVAEDAPELLQEAISESMILEVVSERDMTVKEVDVVTAAVSPELRRSDRPQRTEEKVNVQTELSRIITLVGEEAVSARESEIGYNLEHYMVWKDLDGAIGISNVEYPDRSDMYVAVRDRWYNVKRRPPEGVTETSETPAAVVEKQKNTNEIAANFSRNYLVWKSTGGVIGVGDTQYPDRDPLIVASRDGWNELERPAVSAAGAVSAGSVAAGDLPQGDARPMAADISRKYLVWKNADGTIGIGDTQYPERTGLEVASTAGWTVRPDEPLPEKGMASASHAKAEQKPTDEKLLAAGIGGQYLMWKDKNGKIGFGNVEYPELRDLAYVHTGGSWQKVVN